MVRRLRKKNYPGTGLILPTRLGMGFFPIFTFMSKKLVYMITGATTPSDEPYR
jgi:hypothetical protein